jgi:isoquinoline 1-oxidoreductase alpha subunit
VTAQEWAFGTWHFAIWSSSSEAMTETSVISLTVNGKLHKVETEADKPLLWVLREDLGILGPKYGCGITECGACRVLLNGHSLPSCAIPVGSVADASIVTVEGLSQDDGTLSRVQQAWIDEQVPQCGYCQPGFIIAATALLEESPSPTDAEIDATITNICRCGTYPRIRQAIHRAVRALAEGV